MCQKWKAKHLAFKISIGGIKTRLLIDNGSETELIDECFAHTNKLSTFKLEKAIKLTLGNGEVVQTLTTLRGAQLMWISVTTRSRFCATCAKLDVYTVILGDGWLQTQPFHRLEGTYHKVQLRRLHGKRMPFHGMPCVEFAVGSKDKHLIGRHGPCWL